MQSEFKDNPKPWNKVKRYQEKKKELVHQISGLSCQSCGYNRSYQALDFHHVDKKEKSYEVTKIIRSKGLRIALEEAKKCVTLCANCHREVEAGIIASPPKPGQPADPAQMRIWDDTHQDQYENRKTIDNEVQRRLEISEQYGDVPRSGVSQIDLLREQVHELEIQNKQLQQRLDEINALENQYQLSIPPGQNKKNTLTASIIEHKLSEAQERFYQSLQSLYK